MYKGLRISVQTTATLEAVRQQGSVFIVPYRNKHLIPERTKLY